MAVHAMIGWTQSGSMGDGMSDPTTLACDMTAIPEEERERLCCPFFDFILEVGREGGPVWLALSGGPGVKDYLEETLIPQLEEVRRG